MLKLRFERVLLLPERIIVSNQALNIFQRALKLESLRFKFVLIHPELMPAGFERGRVAEPIVGVVYEVGHWNALLVLVAYTVIEARRLVEGEATSCCYATAFGQKRTLTRYRYRPKVVI